MITDKFRKCIKTNQARPEISFHSRNRLGLRESNCLEVQRQIQFPLIVPGRFIRRLPSRLSRSWRGVIAKQDDDIQASRVRFAAMFSSSLSKPRYRQTFRVTQGRPLSTIPVWYCCRGSRCRSQKVIPHCEAGRVDASHLQRQTAGLSSPGTRILFSSSSLLG